MKRSAGFALVIAATFLVMRVVVTTEASEPPWDAHPFDEPTNGLERALLLHDGQTYAALAQDPALQHPKLFYDDRTHEAYRAGRPMVPWLAWAGSLGQPQAVPAALAAVSVLSVGALAAAAAALARALGRDPSNAWLLLLLPGALAAMAYIGLPDALATAGMLAGFALWRGGRVAWAIAVLALAVLTRETSLIAVAALVLSDRQRGRWALLAIVPYLAWLGVVRARLGEWPFAASSDGTRYTWPFMGLERGIELWGALAWGAWFITVAVVAGAWKRLPTDLRWFTVLWIAVATCLGWHVWARAYDFSRVLLPVAMAAGVVLLPRDRRVREPTAPNPASGIDPIPAS